MGDRQDTIYVTVECVANDQAHGSYYVASSDELSLVTDGKTFEELLKNLREAISLLLEDDVRADFNLVEKPRVVITMTLPEKYARTVIQY
jgi:predicted RNase H-like HicB family nuclease